jgi:hypothetical protein
VAILRGSLRAHLFLGVPGFLALALVVGCAQKVEGVPVAGAAVSPTPAAGPPRFPPSGPISSGDCLAVAEFEVVDCAQPHELEVFRFTQLPADLPDTYPTPAALLPRFEPQCRAELIAYLGSPDADASRLREFVYWPSRQGWKSGERWVLCAVVEIGPDDRPLRRVGALAGALRDGLGRFQACAAGPPSQGPLQVVPCEEPHFGEAVPGVLQLGAPTDPAVSTEEANRIAEPHCRHAIDTFLGSSGGRAGVRYSWRYPLPESWPNGYTSVVCYAETETPRTGSLRSN